MLKCIISDIAGNRLNVLSLLPISSLKDIARSGNAGLQDLQWPRTFQYAGCLLRRCLSLVITSSARLSAQTAGSVSGHVSDPSGAVIADASATQKYWYRTRSTVTTGSGDYTFTEVPPGTYRIEVKHQGFKTAEQQLRVQVQQSLRQDFTLEVGQVTESVTVEATGALLQVENASLGTVVENKAVNELPLNGRNYLGLVALSSNVNTLSPGSGQAGAAWAAIAPASRSRSAASASCSTTTRWMA